LGKPLKGLLVFVLIATLVITGCTKNKSSDLPASSTSPSQSGDASKDSGNAGADKPEELKILYATVEAGSEAIIDATKKYTDQTGIKVKMDTFPYNNLQEKAFSELAQKSDYYDIIVIDVAWVPQLISHLLPITSFVEGTKNPTVLNEKDFVAKAFLDTTVFKSDAPSTQPPAMEVVDIKAIKDAGFDIYGLPIQSNALTVSYRKDLFNDQKNKDDFKAKFGRELAIPNTLDEYLDIAKFFTNGKDMFGTTLMGAKHEANFVDFKSFLSDFGGSVFDDQMKPILNNEAGVKALETYGSWILKDKVTPPGVTTYTWDEVATVFGSGNVAMAMNYHDMKLDQNVKGEVGYFVFPGVQNGSEIVRGPHAGTWMLSLNKYGKQHQGAYDLVEWLANEENQKNYIQFNQHVTRTSAYKAAEGIEDPLKKEYYKVLGESLAVGVGRPRITNYQQMSETVQIAVSNYLTGKMTAKEALDDAAKRIDTLMKEAGYYK
jgi:multiple sugar transport system substrate-binding protein